jgi:hypothetical protein
MEPHGNEQNKKYYDPLDTFSVEYSLKFRNELICISLKILGLCNLCRHKTLWKVSSFQKRSQEMIGPMVRSL